MSLLVVALLISPAIVFWILVRRAQTLTPLERELLADPALDDSPLTIRHGDFTSVPSSCEPDSPPAVLRTVHVSATSGRNPHPANLPAIVLIHGLGGQLGQFDYLVDFFAYYAEVLAFDLPGCGSTPPDTVLPSRLYEAASLSQIIIRAIDSVLGSPDREVILLGHSLGATMAAHLALNADFGRRVRGLIAICPPAPPPPQFQKLQTVARHTPPALFDIFRYFDRRSGLDSPSVVRMLGTFDNPVAETAMRRRQLRWNLQSRSETFLAMAAGASIPSLDQWAHIEIPVCLVGAQLDKVTPAETVNRIADALVIAGNNQVRVSIIPKTGHMCLVDHHELVCGIINDFIVGSIDQRLSLGWQLADIASRDDKWSLKNEAKWRSVEAVSAVVGSSPFRAMKTLRQDDPVSNPRTLEQSYPDISDIIDISRDSPPYDPSTFSTIKYHKFPTVSKIPPSRVQVNDFIDLVDSITAGNASHIVAVHCHYGFNRTGFLICCYLIQRLGKSVREAVNDFKLARPPGIKHPHFIDELYVRYTL
ncbi:Alpha/Beta hydrolase protein [Lipomyces oligophaga]|uniref:Alpha/Beta hydrolase protein n=1 Tax=Lipomyces oligophaga TaxID=45792 RepID=UPI0034CEEA66